MIESDSPEEERERKLIVHSSRYCSETTKHIDTHTNTTKNELREREHTHRWYYSANDSKRAGNSTDDPICICVHLFCFSHTSTSQLLSIWVVVVYGHEKEPHAHTQGFHHSCESFSHASPTVHVKRQANKREREAEEKKIELTRACMWENKVRQRAKFFICSSQNSHLKEMKTTAPLQRRATKSMRSVVVALLPLSLSSSSSSSL